jgi:hypothetical protein|tara:strand:- start:1912 stop:2115 length:204 start_codon:yes stop_codon:yes gene_type:complete
MYYFFSVIVLSMLPTGEPLIEQSVTGPFLQKEHCVAYENLIKAISEQTPTSNILESECRKEDKGKAI